MAAYLLRGSIQHGNLNYYSGGFDRPAGGGFDRSAGGRFDKPAGGRFDKPAVRKLA